MKKQILTLIMGIMIGAVITASVFLIIKPKSSRNVPDFSSFNKDGSGFNFNKEGRSRNSDETGESNSVEDNKTEKESNDEKQN